MSSKFRVNELLLCPHQKIDHKIPEGTQAALCVCVYILTCAHLCYIWKWGCRGRGASIRVRIHKKGLKSLLRAKIPLAPLLFHPLLQVIDHLQEAPLPSGSCLGLPNGEVLRGGHPQESRKEKTPTWKVLSGHQSCQVATTQSSLFSHNCSLPAPSSSEQKKLCCHKSQGTALTYVVLLHPAQVLNLNVLPVF